MIPILICLALGLLSGHLLRHAPRGLHRGLDWCGTVAVWVLLGVLGLRVGADEQVMSNLGPLAGRSVVLGIAAVAGSILLLAVAGRFIMKDIDDVA
jgi:hypothetical protein